jgi:putative acetyltransferase
MAVRIAVESPLSDDVRRLVAALNAHLLPLSPVEFQFKMTVEEMATPSVSVFVARTDDGTAVAMGALKDHGAGTGEVKRMFTAPDRRHARLGSLILEAITAEASRRNMTRLVLETGVGPGFVPAHRLYEAHGFMPCGAFLDYPDSGHSRFYEKRLTQ